MATNSWNNRIDVLGAGTIGPREPVFVIAEAGVNHNGDMDIARRMIDTAAEAGANAVKFQSFQVDRLLTRSAPKAEYQIAQTGAEKSQFEMLEALQLSERDHRLLIEHCADRSIAFLSTPFEEQSADLLEALNVPAFKIPSGEVTNLPFLSYVSAKNRPIILSTGMSDLAEVETAARTIAEGGCNDLVVLHCLSNYPADPAQANLRAIPTISEKLNCLVGYSDHTLGIAVSLAAVALGATVIEKHFTLDRSMTGPDHAASLEPIELCQLVEGIRTVSASLGDGIKQMQESEAATARVARKSLCTVQSIPQGTIITDAMIDIRRPGTGIPPSKHASVVGRRTSRSLPVDTVLNWTDLE